MPRKHWGLHIGSFLVAVLAAMALCARPAVGHAPSAGATAQQVSTEMDAILFVQSLPTKDGKDGIHLVWVPAPIQKLCLGKTSQQCANIDYCIRTTNRDVSMCRNLGIPLSRLPSYPPDMTPRRQLSVVLMLLSPDHFTMLQDFYRRAPRASLERLSLSARVKARVRLTRTSDDDSFEVLEILAVAPF